jgi:xanthine dehydrogenase accessory factor
MNDASELNAASASISEGERRVGGRSARMEPSGNLPREWLSAVLKLLEREPAVVRIVVAQVSGSAPREPGAFMLAAPDCLEGTIGGGRLEWEAIAAARELLHDESAAARLSTVVLGADLGQCCGGVVAVWLERFTREDVGFLRLVRETAAREHAVLSSTVQGAVVDRRLVCATGGVNEGGVNGGGVNGGDERLARGGEAAGRDAAGGDAAGGDAAGGDAAGGSVAAADAAGSDTLGWDRADVSEGGDLVEAQAQALLRKPRDNAGPRIVRDMGGGVRFLERLDDELPAIWLYGAGHVGQALARILAELPLRLTWIDSRAELFPAVEPDGVRIRRDADSLATVCAAPAGTYFLVMTHSHPLDFALCHAILERNDFAWLGLIGSESKAARFRSRLKRAGVPPQTLARLVCPIGIGGIESKWPAAIAVGVAAQVMQRISAAARDRGVIGNGRAVFGPIARVDAAGSPVQAAGKGAAADCRGENCSTCGTAAVPPAAPVVGRS